jgi:hypothetical protein
MLNNSRKPIRQGDVLLIPMHASPKDGKKLGHLTLAEGEVTGHSHRISSGQAELYERNGTLYLKILSDLAVLNHEEHQALEIPQGNWMIRIQREYYPVPPVENNSFVIPQKTVLTQTTTTPKKKPNFPAQKKSQTPVKTTTLTQENQPNFQTQNLDLESVEFLRELLAEADYWERHITGLERQKEAEDRRKRRLQKEKEEEEKIKKRNRRLSRQDYEEMREIQMLLPLIQDRPKPLLEPDPELEIEPEPTPNITERMRNFIQRSQRSQRNWRNVVD